MGYATRDDLVSRFGETEVAQLSDRANTGQINEAVVADKLADAEAEIDAYLGGRFKLPLQVVPEVLKRVACDIARYHLQDDRATEDVVRRYKDAITFLQLIVKGTVSIGADPLGQTPAASDLPDFAGGERTFDARSLKDFTR
ncbi:gp436 family protein [Pseudoxanthomonas winnipegensis]|uniref:gp436 family protein n=1 Tax=Pseudoxanthomonas winnipegensis TaxID=2480810 RepID=UPI00103BE03C|nr:phage protein Gp36 family protein [Pseudoxanthomonas winnipegensis]TBV76875.1 DUF1320 domain-containing protein [Pseudoxanthomonas winnipegensis]